MAGALRPFRLGEEELGRCDARRDRRRDGKQLHPQTSEQALEVLQKKYPKVPPSVVEKAFGDNILPNIRGDGKFSEEMWASTGQVLQEGVFIPKPLDVTEGAIWTNNYINVESAKVY